VRVPSVTEALSLAGFVDFEGIPREVLETAARRGNDVHEWLEALDLGLLSPDTEPDERSAPYVAAWRLFRAENKVEVEAAERILVSKRWRFAGMVDLVCVLNGTPAVLDYKTGARTVAWGPQLAGYALALREEEGKGAKARERWTCQLGVDSGYRLLRHDSRDDEADFHGALRVAHFRLRHGLATIAGIR